MTIKLQGTTTMNKGTNHKQRDNVVKERDDVVKVLKSSEIENIYFNEFVLGVSKNDMFILASRNGKVEAVLNMSHITAKSLALSLTEAIHNFEKKTNQEIINSEDIEKALQSNE